MKNIFLILILSIAYFIPARLPAQVVLYFDTISLACNATGAVTIPVKVKNFNAVGVVQFTAQWDQSKLGYTQVSAINPVFANGADIAQISTNFTQNGQVTYLWVKSNNGNGQSVADGTTIFSIDFNYLGGGFGSISIPTTGNPPLSLEVAYANGNISNTTIVPGGATSADTQAPSIACPPGQSIQSNVPVAVNNLAASGISDNCGAPIVGWAVSGATTAANTASSDASGTTFNPGTSTLTYVALDAANNVASCSVVIEIETTTPQIDTLTLRASAQNLPCGSTKAFVDVTVENFNAIASLTFSNAWDTAFLKFDSVGMFNALLNLNLNDNFNTTLASTEGKLGFLWVNFNTTQLNLPSGARLYRIYFTLKNSNFGSQSAISFGNDPVFQEASTNATLPPSLVPMKTAAGRVRITDTALPVIICPQNVLLDLPIGQTSAPVTGLLPIVSDNCSNATFSYTRSGATAGSGNGLADGTYNTGVTTVTYRATDGAGNSATCAFTVTITSGDTLVLNIDSISVNCKLAGDTIYVPFTVKDFSDISGLQFNTIWDETVLKLDTIQQIYPGLTLQNISLFFLDRDIGVFHFFGAASPTWPSIPDDDTLFVLRFILLDPGNSTDLTFLSLPGLDIEAVNTSFQLLQVATQHGHFVSTLAGNLTLANCPNDTTVTTLPAECSALINFAQPTVTGACTAVSVVQSPVSSTFPLGETQVTFTATDQLNNSASCVFTVTVEQFDTLGLVCPANVNVNTDPGECTAVVNLQQPSTLHACTSTFMSNDAPVGLVFSVGETLVTFTVTDLLGNTATCSLTVEVASNDPLALACPGNIVVNADPGECEANVNVPQPSVSGACTGVSLVQDPPLTTFPAGLTTVTFTATDQLGNSQSCSLTVRVNTDLNLSLQCPANIVVNATPNMCSAEIAVPSPDVSDACGTPTITRTPTGNVFPSGQTVVTYTATDQLGNTATCTLLITVNDNVPPTLNNCPSDITVNTAAGTCTRLVFWPNPVANDSCDNNLTVTTTHPSGFEFQLGTTIVTYTVTDDANLSAACTFRVTVRDNNVPSITCPANITVQTLPDICKAVVEWPNPTTNDLCDNSLAIFPNVPSGDSLDLGITFVTFTATDDAGNSSTCSFQITVEDGTAPVLNNCPASITVSVTDSDPTLGCGTDVAWSPPTAAGLCSSTGISISSNFQSGAFFPEGATEVVYYAERTGGLKDSCKFTITVVDDMPPVFSSFPPNYVIQLPPHRCDTILVWPLPVATDLCGVASVTLTSPPGFMLGMPLDIGPKIIRYVATDDAGNSATKEFTVDVQDVTPPNINNCPPDVTVAAGADCKAVVTWPMVTATDQCDPQADVFPANFLTGGTFSSGESEIVIVAVDNWNNYDSCFVKITVTGAANPSLQNCPQNLPPITGCTSGQVTWPSPFAVGFCDAVQIDSSHAFGEFPLGVTTVVYTATDGASTVTCSFLITVTESLPPQFTCPPSLTVNVAGQIVSDPGNLIDSAKVVNGCNELILFFDAPDAIDNCGNVIVSQNPGTILSGGKFPVGATTVSFRATDGVGLTSECNIKITVERLPMPEILVSPNPACEFETVVLDVKDPLPGANYTWTGALQTFPNEPEVTIPTLDSSNDGIYGVFLEINGCRTERDTANVVMVGRPEAKDDGIIEVNAGEAIPSIDVLDNDVFSPNDEPVVSQLGSVNGITYEGNGIFSFAGSNDPGFVTFIYTLCHKTCPDSCDMATVSIKIQDNRCVFFPNIITPNGDGQNDDFYIPCLDTGAYPNNSLTIYNQWGDIVFDAAPYKNGPLTGWTGLLHGNAGQTVPDGVYYYIFKTSQDASAEIKKGFIEVLR